ncbi:MAG TPA: SDR family oxidoreductase [Balneolales bacterium]|nr:SDR family oxidoreductase [Balneolales bacterium]
MISKNISELLSLEGKNALITGGGSGLGYAIAEKFTKAGARVVITGRREEVLKEAVRKLGDKATYAVNDIREFDSLTAMVEQIETEIGAIEILVNNAGVNLKKIATEVTNEEFINIIQTNLIGLFILTREVSLKMLARRSGSIIMITSMAALYGIPGVAAYSASKSGVLGLTRTLAVDLSPHGIRVNAIAPGFIESPMLLKAMDVDPEREQKVLGRTPMNMFGKPEHIANAALYLASDMAEFVTGTNIPVDGGNSIGF